MSSECPEPNSVLSPTPFCDSNPSIFKDMESTASVSRKTTETEDIGHPSLAAMLQEQLNPAPTPVKNAANQDFDVPSGSEPQLSISDKPNTQQSQSIMVNGASEKDKTNLSQDKQAESDSGDESEDELAVVQVSPCGRWQKRKQAVSQRDVPGIDAAYLAMDDVDGVEVVWNEVRISEKKSSKSGSKREQLKQVFDNLTQLRHPNIVIFHAHWTDETDSKPKVIFITEYMSSGSLKMFLDRTKTMKIIKSWKRWCTQILSALSYLHSCDPPIVHGNLTCDTIFIQHNGLIKIGSVAPDAISNNVKTYRGDARSLHYIAPEYADISPENYDRVLATKADIYSFGICALEMAVLNFAGNGHAESSPSSGKSTSSGSAFKRIPSDSAEPSVSATGQKSSRNPGQQSAVTEPPKSGMSPNEQRTKELKEPVKNGESPLVRKSSTGGEVVSTFVRKSSQESSKNGSGEKPVPSKPQRVHQDVIKKALESLEDPQQKDFIQKCLSINPADRPSARELLLHPVLFEVHSLKTLSAHVYVQNRKLLPDTDTHVSRREPDRVFAEINFPQYASPDTQSSEETSESIPSSTRTDVQVRFREAMKHQSDLDNFLEDVSNGVYPLTAFAPSMPSENRQNAPRPLSPVKEEKDLKSAVRRSPEQSEETHLLREERGVVASYAEVRLLPSETDPKENCPHVLLYIAFDDECNRSLRCPLEPEDSGSVMARELATLAFINETGVEAVANSIDTAISLHKGKISDSYIPSEQELLGIQIASEIDLSQIMSEER